MRLVASAFIVICIFLVPAVIAQSASQLPPNAPQHTHRRPGQPPVDESGLALTREMVDKINRDRYSRLKKDTDELLRLATELKQSVDAAGQNTLSLDTMKKAEQIEKLAKDVKNRMKGS